MVIQLLESLIGVGSVVVLTRLSGRDLDSIYVRSRYGDDIDYTKPLDPPIPEADQSWLQEQLKTQQAHP